MIRIRMGPDNADLLTQPGVFREEDWELEDRDDRVVKIKGQLLGGATSQRLEHNHGHELLGPTSSRCAACRWSEIYIFRVTDGDGPATSHYAVYTLGPSLAPGEKTFVNVRWAVSALEVVELATVRRGDRGVPYLPAAHSRALAMAAAVDTRLEDAYVNRAVA